MPNPIGRPPTEDEFIINEGNALIEWMRQPENIFVNRFASNRGYHSSRFNDWSKSNKDFALIYARAKELQELKLAEGGLHGKYKEQITKFVLVNHHNYREKTEQAIQQETTFTVKTVNYNDKPTLTDKRDEPIEIDVVPAFDP